MRKRALVLGGAGFIGSHLSDKLLERDYEVFVVDNLRSGKVENIKHNHIDERFWFEQLSVSEKKVQRVFQIFRPEYVFHLAAVPSVSFSVENPFLTNETNVGGLVNILELSRTYNVKRLIFSSSSSVYGGSENLPVKESEPLTPKSPYALQKKIGEEYCRLFSEQYNLDTACLRYFNVFGPRQDGTSPYSSVISSFLNCKKTLKPPKIHGDGEQFRDFCYVDNVVSANILAAECSDKLKGEAFNVGCGGKITVNMIAKIIGGLPAEYEGVRAGDVRVSQADITKAEDILKYKVLKTFDEGMKETISWYLNGV